MDCYSVGNCIAVGGPDLGTEPGPALVFSSVNGKWSQADNQPTDPNGQGSTLLGVSCAGLVLRDGRYGGSADRRGRLLCGWIDCISDARVATITAPPSGNTYTPGQVAPTAFACTEGAFGPGPASCLDSNGAAAPASSTPPVWAATPTLSLLRAPMARAIRHQ